MDQNSIEDQQKRLTEFSQTVGEAIDLLMQYHDFLKDAQRIDFSGDFWRCEEGCEDCDPFSDRLSDLLAKLCKL